MQNNLNIGHVYSDDDNYYIIIIIRKKYIAFKSIKSMNGHSTIQFIQVFSLFKSLL